MYSFIEIDYKISRELPTLESRVQRFVQASSQSVGFDPGLESQGAIIRQEIEATLMRLLETKTHLQGVSPSLEDDTDAGSGVDEGADTGAGTGAYPGGKTRHQDIKAGGLLENVNTMQQTKILNGYIEEYVALKQTVVKAINSMSAKKMGGGMAAVDAWERAHDQASKMQELVSMAANLQDPVTKLKHHQILLRAGLDEDARLIDDLGADIDARAADARIATGHAKTASRLLCRHNDCKYLTIAIVFGVILIVCLIWL
ncbi:Hypothetical protein GLP15_4770 [Giardia lamblia P15]|uniref:Uncharacterized protein n=1 Tax=Giardia intestinalis (strain P15) TaxID=658858 RepID=E1F4I6_GIAIA|nr:Hypothetical protein GLP15_4770 [Giardia lamblia P15]